MKQVEQLKKKHRGSLWQDKDRDLWFYDIHRDSWRWVSGYSELPAGVSHISEGGVIGTKPLSHLGPFTRVVKFR